jgi:EpsI family protein
MGVMAYRYGESMLHGPLHIFQGLFVSQAGIFFLFLVNWGVMKLPCDRIGTLHRRWKDISVPIVPPGDPTRPAGPSAFLIISLLVFGCYLHFLASPYRVPLKQPLTDLPYVIGRWDARDSAWIEGSRFFPGAAAETGRTYHTSGKTIFLYVGYFTSQRQGESLINVHANPIGLDTREVLLNKAIAGLQRVNHSLPTIDGKRYEALFWYHLPSRKTTGRYETKLRQILDAAFHGHNNGAVILLATPAGENRDRGMAVNDLLQFASVLAPVLEEYLP